jgi:primosomal protein N' (replication factor Y)
MKNVKPGVTRVREELEAAARRPVVVVTGESEDVVPPAGVYVGTEAVLHRVRHADVVAFLDMDAELLAPRYRAAEQAMTLLVRGARLAGPRAGGGRMLVQTFLPRHEVLQAALLADPGRLAAHEARTRAELGFPPSSALATMDGTGADEIAAALRAEGVVEVAGPSRGVYLLRCDDWMQLGHALDQGPRPPRARVRIAVDPPRR